MRYHYERPDNMPRQSFGRTYSCSHPVYSRCTLFTIGKKGLAVIQQRYDSKTKTTWWTEIDQYMEHELYLHPNFKAYFDERAREPVNNLYPTVTIRQIMWALKIKPLPKERWETTFDRREI